MNARTMIAGVKWACGDNYVIFEREGRGTRIHRSPPLVAVWRSGQRETWESTALARSLIPIVLRSTRRLRTRNSQQPHRHITYEHQDVSMWRRDLDEFARKHRLRARVKE